MNQGYFIFYLSPRDVVLSSAENPYPIPSVQSGLVRALAGLVLAKGNNRLWSNRTSPGPSQTSLGYPHPRFSTNQTSPSLNRTSLG
jgi:hypothetical protein